ncbi:MAG: hypothetical protein IPQ13_07535 [Holophagaceae bacterium]|nr:hypothetical protein [Holophagaceae bacterium]
MMAELGALETELLVDDRMQKDSSLLDREATPLAFILAFIPAVLVLTALPPAQSRLPAAERGLGRWNDGSRLLSVL